MPEQNEAIQIDHYLELISRHRWFIIIPFCLAMVAGIVLVFTLPKIYEASTLILIQPPRVPENYVQSIVSSDIESRISTISQQILSRTNLEKIIARFHLFSRPSQQDMFMEDKIADLRKRIQVQVTRARKRKDADAFSISFQGRQPQLVMQVANALASFFIDENLKTREAQAVGTSDFLEDELSTMKKRLAEVEGKIKDYRRRYMGELPEQLDTNLRILDRLQMQLNDRQESLRSARNRLVAVENEIKAGASQPAAAAPAAAAGQGEPTDLFALKQQLAQLKTTYTDRHPDVIRLKNRIRKLEAEMAAGNAAGQPASKKPAASPTFGLDRRTNAALLRQQTETRGEINSLKVDIENITRQIKTYQQRVEATPKHEQALTSLERDYNNIKASYDSLLSRKLEAEIAVNLEKKQKGEQFRIIDPARLPEKPVSPNMTRLFLMVLAAGLGLGGAVVFLIDYLDSSVRRPEELEAQLGIAVLATIPRIQHRRDRVRRRINQVLTACSVFVAACLVAAFAVLVFNGVEPTMEVVNRFVHI